MRYHGMLNIAFSITTSRSASLHATLRSLFYYSCVHAASHALTVPSKATTVTSGRSVRFSTPTYHQAARREA